ncbi:unnamed protein product [Lactuca virosa]|uniref:Uncharacterized protein n=1 Tax=Lactuca virosa TaxID=75947 RepID=A0AAU9PMJ8_9ASTR|nr:unnamed protein product [Lactuca virosa]
MERLLDQETNEKVDSQVDEFKYKRGLFGYNAALTSYLKRPPEVEEKVCLKEEARSDDPLIVEELPSDDEWLADPSIEDDENSEEVGTDEVATDVGTSASSSSKRRKGVQLNLVDEDDELDGQMEDDDDLGFC